MLSDFKTFYCLSSQAAKNCKAQPLKHPCCFVQRNKVNINESKRSFLVYIFIPCIL